MSIWSALWDGVNAAITSYKGGSAVVTDSTNDAVDNLANDAALVTAIVALIAEKIPATSLVAPLIADIVKGLLQALVNHITEGVKTGTIIPDGKGGFVPSHGQSTYDPETGEFTGNKT